MSDPVTSAVIGGAAQAGKAALRTQREKNRKVNDELLEGAKQTPEFAKAVEAYGQRQAMKQILITGLFKKALQKFVGSADYFEVDFFRDLTQKTQHIPKEDLQEPVLSIAAPAIQGLAWSVDEPNLKEMYLRLLATASDSRIAISAHPSFVEVIKQVTAEEAELLADALYRPASTIMRIVSKRTSDLAFHVVQNHILNWYDDVDNDQIVSPPFGATYVDNWMRLGLVEVRYDQWLTPEERYDWMDGRPELDIARSLYPSAEGWQMIAEKGMLTRTNFGHQFANAVGLLGDAT